MFEMMQYVIEPPAPCPSQIVSFFFNQQGLTDVASFRRLEMTTDLI